jgi:hypothetical protein
MNGSRAAGTNPRSQGTSPRQQGVNPRAVTVERFEQLEAKVDELLRLVRNTGRTYDYGTRAEPLTDHDRGTFLPGTGWLKDAGVRARTPEALAALEQLRQRDDQ